MTGYGVIRASRYFSLDEFVTPEGESFAEDLEDVRPDLLYAVEDVRADWGRPIHPSRLRRGLVCRGPGDSESQHYADASRLCAAIDLFPEGSPAAFLACVLMHVQFKGVGIYGDTKISKLQPGPMFHLDIRTGNRVFWARVDGEYIYKNSEPSRYFEALREIFCKQCAMKAKN